MQDLNLEFYLKPEKKDQEPELIKHKVEIPQYFREYNKGEFRNRTRISLFINKTIRELLTKAKILNQYFDDEDEEDDTFQELNENRKKKKFIDFVISAIKIAEK